MAIAIHAYRYWPRKSDDAQEKVNELGSEPGIRSDDALYIMQEKVNELGSEPEIRSALITETALKDDLKITRQNTQLTERMNVLNIFSKSLAFKRTI
jgi:hypothetical protein